jgi:hypothetical protein
VAPAVPARRAGPGLADQRRAAGALSEDERAELARPRITTAALRIDTMSVRQMPVAMIAGQRDR